MDAKTSLTYKQMQDGMVILSAVRQVTNLTLQIEFPGLTFGQVRITSISDILNNYLSNHMDEVDANDPMLKNMFPIGSFVPAKVMKLEENDKGFKVEASLNPKDINANKRHNSFKKGMLMWACIQSELDHGYQLSNGISNCKIFLPTKNVDEGKTYRIGQPLWCVVHKCEENQSTSILRVSAKWEHITKAKQEELDSLHNLIPGMQVELFVDKINPNGLEGRFLDDYPGYVDQNQLAKPLHSLAKVKEGSLVNARVLYIEPVTNITHLSLRGLETVPQPQYKVGHIITAEVLLKSPRGLFLKLNKEEKGFVTNKRLLKTLPRNAESDLDNAIRKKYPTGCKKQARIIDFNHMERIYICTLETDLVKEKMFTPNDLTVGELVTGTVEESKPDGLVISVGHVKGFVPNMHVANTQYSDNIKKKFTVGTQVTAKVWNITEQGNIIFTLKQALIKSEVCLKNLEEAKSSTMYPGIVIQSKESGALVAFYGGIMGWISTRQLKNDQGSHVDPREFFFRGQVASFRSLGVKNGRLQLSSNALPARKRKISEHDESVESDRSLTDSGNKKKKADIKKEKELKGRLTNGNQEEESNLTEKAKEQLKNTSKSESQHVEGANTEKTKKKKKRKKKSKVERSLSEVNENENGKKDSLSDEVSDTDISSKHNVKKQELSECPDKDECIKSVNNSKNSKPVMPGIEGFFSVGNQQDISGDSSSSDDEGEVDKTSKTKKLTPAERAEMIFLKDDRRRKVEEELAENEMNPQCAEHFEHLVSANPNSSDLWLKYIAFHVSCMELDKARTVARRAIESINMTLCEEKLNVWICYLGLENMYGTKESFENVFEEAVKLNDDMTVYLRAIELLAESGKISEMEEKVKKVKNKFKHNPLMWETLGKVYYLMKNFKEARNCKNLAIRSIQDKKTQLNLIVRFAIMEFKYGEEDAGSAVFETILQSDPRKVNIWITYVDQLTKKGSIDLARRVLERSVCQKLPLKSMKTLFMKFRTFEEKYGTPESVNEVKRKAAEYVARCQA